MILIPKTITMLVKIFNVLLERFPVAKSIPKRNVSPRSGRNMFNEKYNPFKIIINGYHHHKGCMIKSRAGLNFSGSVISFLALSTLNIPCSSTG